jgi:hypothetical protein
MDKTTYKTAKDCIIDGASFPAGANITTSKRRGEDLIAQGILEVAETKPNMETKK